MPVDLFAPRAFSPPPIDLPGDEPTPAAQATAPVKPIGKLEPEYHTAFQAWRDAPNAASNHALLTAVQPVVDTAIQSYGAGSQGSPTLRSRARLMALDAVKSYDPEKGTLRTHLLSNLRGLQRVGAGEANIINMPEQVALDRRQLQESTTELEDSLGRTPSDRELADHTGLSMKRLRYIRQGHTGLATGTYDEGSNAEAVMPASEDVGQSGDDAWVDLVYHDLGPIDQVVLQHTLGWNGHSVLDTAAIASKLGITPGAVSQRRKKIQTLLDQRYTSNLGI